MTKWRKSDRERLRAHFERWKLPKADSAFSVTEYADVTGYTRDEVRRALEDGRLPMVRHSGRTCVKVTLEVLGFLNAVLDIDLAEQEGDPEVGTISHENRKVEKHPPMMQAEDLKRWKQLAPRLPVPMSVTEYADFTGYTRDEVRRALEDGRLPMVLHKGRRAVNTTRKVLDFLQSLLDTNEAEMNREGRWVSHEHRRFEKHPPLT